MLEIPLRFRCDTCGLALEMPGGMSQPLQFPMRLNLEVPGIPNGWTFHGVKIGCPQHPARLVEPVTRFDNVIDINGRH